MTSAIPLKHQKRRSDSSSDALSNGGPSPLKMLMHGARCAPPGALYVLGVLSIIALVAILARA